MGQMTYFVVFLDFFRMSGMAGARHSGACSVCSAFDATFAKLLWPLVFSAVGVT